MKNFILISTSKSTAIQTEILRDTGEDETLGSVLLVARLRSCRLPIADFSFLGFGFRVFF